MKLAWATDIHFDHLDDDGKISALEALSTSGADDIVICGDIGTANNLIWSLSKIDEHIPFGASVYFVLGNHDFYNSSVKKVRHLVSEFCRSHVRMEYLHFSHHPVRIGKNTCIIGCDGWGDSLNGDFEDTRVRMSDFAYIEDLCWLTHEELRKKLIAFGEESANKIRRLLMMAVRRFPNIIMATHIPPFVESSWYEGKQSSVDFLPFFTCAAVGRVLEEVMGKFPDNKLTVLCGHSHGGGEFIKGNIRVLTGKAEYGKVTKQEILCTG
jgi:predicted phosphohydrolase